MAGKYSKIFEFVTLIGCLKRTKRTGWVLRNVQEPESVADHMYRMAAMAFLANPSTGLNRERCIKLCLVHDMAESIVGDLTPSCGVSKEEKHAREKAAMEHIVSLVDSDTGKELFTLWQEYEDQTSAESKFVKDLDRFDMITQAFEYEQADNTPGKLQEFFDSTKDKFQDPTVQQMVTELKERRQKYLGDIQSNSPDAEKNDACLQMSFT